MKDIWIVAVRQTEDQPWVLLDRVFEYPGNAALAADDERKRGVVAIVVRYAPTAEGQ